LRRTTEAVAALKKSVESDDELYSADEIEKEPDLKPLAALPAFKKLIAEIRRSEEGQAEPQKKEPDKRD
jgi:hypothetical protein